VVGPPRPLEGPAGYARLVEGGQFDRAKALDGLGATWLLDQVTIRPYPVAPSAAAAVEAALQLGGGRVPLARLQQVVVEASEAVVSAGGSRPGPAAPAAELRRSLVYLVARALRDGWVGLASVAPSATLDLELWDLMGRIELAVSPEFPVDALAPVRVVALTTDGLLLESTVESMPGDLGNEITRQRLLSKLADCWRWSGQPHYRRPLRIADAVQALDHAQSLSAFWSAVSPQAVL
jgi:2-methylcitrate dehydratase PrpD